MSNKARVQIERINGEPEVYQNEKMKVPKTTFICDGYIDGEAAQDFIVQAFGRKADMVTEGFDFLADIDINPFNKRTQYVVPREMAAPGRSNPPPRASNPRPAPAAQGRAAVPANAPTKAPAAGGSGGYHAPSYTLPEFDALFRHGTDMVISLLPVPDGQCVDADSVSRLVSTYMISAVQLGVKVSDGLPAATQPEAPPAIEMSKLIEILEGKGLAKRVDEANISEDDLINMWKAADGSKLKFGMLVNEALKAAESGASQGVADAPSNAEDVNLPF